MVIMTREQNENYQNKIVETLFLKTENDLQYEESTCSFTGDINKHMSGL